MYKNRSKHSSFSGWVKTNATFSQTMRIFNASLLCALVVLRLVHLWETRLVCEVYSFLFSCLWTWHNCFQDTLHSKSNDSSINTIAMELSLRAKPYHSPENIRELRIEDLGKIRFYLSKFADCLVAHVKNPRIVDGNLCNTLNWMSMSFWSTILPSLAGSECAKRMRTCLEESSENVPLFLMRLISRKFGGLDIYRRVASTADFQWIVPNGLSLEVRIREIFDFLLMKNRQLLKNNGCPLKILACFRIRLPLIFT